MATYSRKQELVETSPDNQFTDEFTLAEQMIYGASRLGTDNRNLVLTTADINQPNTNSPDLETGGGLIWSNVVNNSYDKTQRIVGQKFYETEDIENGQLSGNYKYDASGQLTQDVQEGIENIEWTVTGKVKEITFAAHTGKYGIKFIYDPMDMRVAKMVYLNDDHSHIEYTYYSYDALGNVMATYSRTQELQATTPDNQFTDEFTLAEQMIYGASRLGADNRNLILTTAQINQPNTNSPDLETGVGLVWSNIADNSYDKTQRIVGNKSYEKSEHRGNVLVVITDRKVTYDDNGVTVYSADVISYSDYYPYGMLMDGRHGSNADYRYGFNGMECDNEVKGNRSSYTTEFRQYDPRIGRWLSLDPLMTKYPNQSPYCAFNNNPIFYRDPTGLEGDPPQFGESCIDEEKQIRTWNGTDWSSPEEFLNLLQTRINANNANLEAADETFDRLAVVLKDNQRTIAKKAERDARIELMKQEFAKIQYTLDNFTNYMYWKNSNINQRSLRFTAVFPESYDELQKLLNPPTINLPYRVNPSDLATGAATSADWVWTLPLGGGIGKTIKVGLGSATLGAGMSFASQMYVYKDINKVDWAGVGAGGVGGMFKNPWVGATTASLLDAGFDVSFQGVQTPFTKDWGHMGNDFLWGSLGNYGSASFAKYPMFFRAVGTSVVTFPTTGLNKLTNDQFGF